MDLSIEFQLFYEDFLAYQMLESHRNGQFRRAVRKLQVLVGLILGCFMVFAVLRERWVAVPVFVVLTAGFVLAMPVYWKWRVKGYYGRHIRTNYAARFGRNATVLFGEEIEVRDADSTSTLAWGKLMGATETAEHLFLHLDVGGALIVPKSRMKELPELRKLLMDRGIGIQHDVKS